MSTYHYLFLFISNIGEGNKKNIQYIKLDNCRLTYSSGNSNDLLEKMGSFYSLTVTFIYFQSILSIMFLIKQEYLT